MLNEITSLDQLNKIKKEQDFFILGFYSEKSASSKEAMDKAHGAGNSRGPGDQNGARPAEH